MKIISIALLTSIVFAGAAYGSPMVVNGHYHTLPPTITVGPSFLPTPQGVGVAIPPLTPPTATDLPVDLPTPINLPEFTPVWLPGSVVH